MRSHTNDLPLDMVPWLADAEARLWRLWDDHGGTHETGPLYMALWLLHSVESDRFPFPIIRITDKGRIVLVFRKDDRELRLIVGADRFSFKRLPAAADSCPDGLVISSHVFFMKQLAEWLYGDGFLGPLT